MKIARVLPIFKEGSREDPANYRPISIISVIAKLIEKLVALRLTKFVDKYFILNNSQFGFRSGHSTTHAITNIHERILENINDGKHTVSIYLDLSKAFDSVNHQILLRKLDHYGVRGVALNFFASYLSRRQQYTSVNGELSSILTVMCGVPQGSTLGPLLFLLYINDLASASDFAVSLFADDTALLKSHTDLKLLERSCNNELIHINNWFLANKLTANRSKASKYMLTLGKIPRGTSLPNITLYMGSTILERVTSIKYLGIIFDEQFKWHEHISFLCKKISKSVGVLSKLRYYTNVKTLIQVYHSLVGSHLTYANIAWGAAGVTALKPLRALQNRAIKFISRATRYRRLDLDYLNLRILKLDDSYRHSIAKFMHQYYLNKLPAYFSTFFVNVRTATRYGSNNHYRPIKCKKAIMENSVRYAGPNRWEKIPPSIRDLKPGAFKKAYTNLLLASY